MVSKSGTISLVNTTAIKILLANVITLITDKFQFKLQYIHRLVEMDFLSTRCNTTDNQITLT